jgi:hypothetical protein
LGKKEGEKNNSIVPEILLIGSPVYPKRFQYNWISKGFHLSLSLARLKYIRKRQRIEESQDLFIVDKFQLGDIADRGRAQWWIGLAGPWESEDLDGVKPLYFNTKRSSEENRIEKINNGIDEKFEKFIHMYYIHKYMYLHSRGNT